MSENVSRLAIAITTDGAIKATTELEKLTGAAKQTEVQAGKTINIFIKVAQAEKTLVTQTEKVKKELTEASEAAKKAKEAATLLAKEEAAAAKEAQKLENATSKLIKDLEMEAMIVDKTADEIKLLKLEQAGATKTQLDAAKAAIANKNAHKELGQQSNVVKGKFGAMKGATQNISYQLQDVAVQAQMGTSAFIILGQQGPQLASIFGPGGAVVGAIIAFGSMLGGLAYSMLVSSKGTEELQSAVRDLGKEYGELTTAQQLLIKTQNDLEIKRLTNENKQLGEQAAYNADVLSKLARAYGQSADAGDGLEASANANRVQMELNAITIAALTAENAGLSKSTADVIASLDLELQMMGKTERQKAILEAQLKKAPQPQIDEINRIYKLIEAKEEALDVDKNLAKRQKEQADADSEFLRAGWNAREAEERNKARLEVEKAAAKTRLDSIMIAGATEFEAIKMIEDQKIAKLKEDRAKILISATEFEAAKTQIEKTAADERAAYTMATEQMALQTAATFAGKITGLMSSAFGEQSAAAKAAFVVQQGIAIAQTIVATEMAAIAAAAQTAVLGGPLAFFASAAGIRAMGYASVGIIAGQTVAQVAGGRALGGQVRGGESYLVGERGPELLTMGTSGRIATNENLKNAVGGGGGVSIVNNVDARGSGPDVESKIRTAMEQTSAQTIATIQDLMRRRRFV